MADAYTTSHSHRRARRRLWQVCFAHFLRVPARFPARSGQQRSVLHTGNNISRNSSACKVKAHSKTHSISSSPSFEGGAARSILSSNQQREDSDSSVFGNDGDEKGQGLLPVK